MNLLVVGASHRTAEVSLLERLSVPEPDFGPLLSRLLRREHVFEAAVVSTCNRVEIYARVSGFHGGVADASAVLAERAGLDPAALAPHLYVRWDADAVGHALRVAAGLDSMVAGESQILGQVRAAYTTATGAGAVGRLLHDVFQQALRVGKRVHAETGIDTAGRSVVTAALELATAVWAEPDDRTMAPAHAAGEPAAGPQLAALAGRAGLVVGAGSMGALALATLSRAGAAPLRVASRTADRADRLARAYGAEPVAMAGLVAPMAGADLVVCATTSTGPVLTRELVAAALARRSAVAPPLVICDLAVPRDVAPAVADLPGVMLIDLSRMAAQAPQAVTSDISAAERIVADEAAAIAGSLRDAAVAPTVAALRARADEVVAAELARLSQRLPELTDSQRREVAHAVHRLVQRLLHQPTVRVRQLAAEPGGQTYAAALAELFDLQVPQPRRVDEVPDLATGDRRGEAPAGGPSGAGGPERYASAVPVTGTDDLEDGQR